MLNLIKSILTTNNSANSKNIYPKPVTLNYLIDLSGEAIVDEAIFPLKKGRCRWKGSYWFARCDLEITLSPEDIVEVVGLDKNTLLVQPIDSEDCHWGTSLI